MPCSKKLSCDCPEIKNTRRRNLMNQLQLLLESIDSESKCAWDENGPKNVTENQLVAIPVGRPVANSPSKSYNPFPKNSEQRRKFEAINKGLPPEIYNDGTCEVRYTTSNHIKQKGSENRNYHYLPDFERKHDPCRKEQYNDRELRAGILYRHCDCTKRNGLQHDCPRTGCRQQTCLNKPDPDCIPSGGCGIKGPPVRTRKYPGTYHPPRTSTESYKLPGERDPFCRAEVPCVVCDPPIKSKTKNLARSDGIHCGSTPYLNKTGCRDEIRKPPYAPRVDWAKVDRAEPPDCQIPKKPPCISTYGDVCCVHDRKPCFEVYCRYCKIHEPKVTRPVRRYNNLDYFQQW